MHLEQVNRLNSPAAATILAAQANLDTWRSQSPFQKDLWFGKRLSLYGLTADRFFRLLCFSHNEDLADTANPPDWVLFIEEAFQNARKERYETSTSEDWTGFGAIFQPLVIEARKRLSVSIRNDVLTNKVSWAPENEFLGRSLSVSLEKLLLPMIVRTCVLELNLARIEGRLICETSESRFDEFIDYLSNPKYSFEILQRYPVLARQLVVQIEQWLHTTIEWMRRLSSDWDFLAERITAGNSLGKLVSINSSVGDRHCNGRSTIILGFDTDIQLLYKPRSVSVDAHFHKLLLWINSRGHEHQFRVARIIDRGDYGWMEFIKHRACLNENEIQGFYERFGSLVAIVYTIGGTDLHRENLIASQEHPILVDLETMFHPTIAWDKSDYKNGVLHDEISTSVLQSGLLPERLWGVGEQLGIDISGVGGDQHQLTPFDVKQWEDSRTDRMSVVRRPGLLQSAENSPSLRGQKVVVTDYVEAIERGFRYTYDFLLKHVAELTSQNGPLFDFQGDTIRVVLRPTRTYATLLSESFHPDLLRDSARREMHFDWLWAQLEHSTHLEKVVGDEIEDLLKGNIPKFVAQANSRHLWSSSNKRIANYFDEAPVERVLRKACSLNNSDMEKQLWFIRASLSTVASRTKTPSIEEEMVFHRLFESNKAEKPQDFRDTLLQHACKIGDRLVTLAYTEKDQANWIGFNYSSHDKWSLEPLACDLYGGTPGVALFLAYLGEATENNLYTELARRATNSILDNWSTSYIRRKLGGYDGLGGLIYSMWHLGVLWQSSELLEQMELMLDEVPSLLEIDNQFDVISGAAGCIGVLLSISGEQYSSRATDLATMCGERLLNSSKSMSSGIGWMTSQMSSQPLGGFSHGVSGIAWALLSLARKTEDHKYCRAGMSAIEYEKSLFSEKHQNWKDLREYGNESEGANQSRFEVAWCHGAPGIGLSRLACLEMIDESSVRSEIKSALDATIECGFTGNHSLCHGSMGNLELLVAAKKYDFCDVSSRKCDRILSSIVSDMEKNGYRCGLPLSVECSGLLTGITGIGFGLLRGAFPDKVPNVLLLE